MDNKLEIIIYKIKTAIQKLMETIYQVLLMIEQQWLTAVGNCRDIRKDMLHILIIKMFFLGIIEIENDIWN